MNEIKALGIAVGELIDRLCKRPDVAADMRWVAIGRTDLQTGFMALARAVAKPTTF